MNRAKNDSSKPGKRIPNASFTFIIPRRRFCRKATQNIQNWGDLARNDVAAGFFQTLKHRVTAVTLSKPRKVTHQQTFGKDNER